jgi:hypothetical protein
LIFEIVEFAVDALYFGFVLVEDSLLALLRELSAFSDVLEVVGFARVALCDHGVDLFHCEWACGKFREGFGFGTDV